jgi:hypothetical protein
MRSLSVSGGPGGRPPGWQSIALGLGVFYVEWMPK